MALVGGLAVVSCMAWWVGRSSQSPEQAAARAEEPAASWITATVERRVLAATVIQRGDVRPESEFVVGVPVSVEGVPVVTQVAVAAGTEIVEGGRVLEVSGRPVFVLTGAVPVYRSLRPGMHGPDVAQLQAALSRLGYQPDADGSFGEATKIAVTAFYADAGYEPIAASATASADIAAAEQSLTEAEAAVVAAERDLEAVVGGQPASVVAAAESAYNQAIRDLDSALTTRDQQLALARAEADTALAARDRVTADPEATPGDIDAARLEVERTAAELSSIDLSTGSAADQAREAVRVADLALAEARATDGVASAQSALDATVLARDQALATRDQTLAINGPTVSQGEIVFVPVAPVRVLSGATTLGPLSTASTPDEVTTAPEALAQLAAGGLVVSTSIRPADSGLIRVGMPVELLDETTTQTYQATVTVIADTPTTSADGQLGYAAVLTPLEPLPDTLTGANLRVTVTAASTDGVALVVPLAAVSSSADGSSRVSLVDGPDDPASIDVPVEAGLSADGFVVIEPTEPEQIKIGDLVVVGH